MAISLRKMGSYEESLDAYKEALPLFRQALEAYARLEDSEEEQADCLEAIGAIEAG